jgi:hypothetical protein
MNQDDISKEQAEQLIKTVGPMVNFLYRLERRMEKKQFPVDDSLFVAVRHAYDEVHKLWIKLHYMTSEGVGRTNKKADERPGEA